MNNIKCEHCKYFKQTQGIYGICKLVEGCIGENCNKYQYCNEFIKGRKLTDKESSYILIQDNNFNQEEFEKVIKPFINNRINKDFIEILGYRM